MAFGSARRWGRLLGGLLLLAVALQGGGCGGEDDISPVGGSPSARKDDAAQPGGREAMRTGPEMRSLRLGEGLTLDLVWVPGGSFQVAVPRTALRSLWRDEDPAPRLPPRQVRVAGFWMGKFEVTNRQFRRFAPAHDSGEYQGVGLNGDSQPAVNVSPEDARAFCRWLSDLTSETLRLPTDAEWEYACRAGAETTWFWGGDEAAMGRYANVADTALREMWPGAAIAKTSDGFAVAAPVGSLRPNAFGLFDMVGNALEWCEDARTAGRGAGAGARQAATRLLEGGSWGSIPESPTEARQSYAAAFRDVYGGFRVVGELPSPPR